ncbi:MAG: hypothetical protein MZU95_16710 [Desulfomicrobium escambiense]|nr:hypothetical protein [Desulfomicrobium escambiense]
MAESLRTGVESRDLRASYFASVQPYHMLHMDVLMRLHKRHPREGLAAAAFEASERARARSLLDSLTEAGVDLRRGMDPDLVEAGAGVEEGVRRLGRAPGRLASGPGTKAATPRPWPRSIGTWSAATTRSRRRSEARALATPPRATAASGPPGGPGAGARRGDAVAGVRPRARAELPLGRFEQGPDQLRAAPRAEIERAATRVYERHRPPG